MEQPFSVFVKEEPDFFGAGDLGCTQSCCLCAEGKKIQKKLVEHLGSKHSQGYKQNITL